jgi:hypothetical protein
MVKSNHFGVLAATAAVLTVVGMLLLMLTPVEPAQAAFPGTNGKTKASEAIGKEIRA